MIATIIVLRSDLVLVVPDRQLTDRDQVGLRDAIDAAMGSEIVVVLPGPADVLDARGDDDLAELAERIRARLVAAGVPA